MKPFKLDQIVGAPVEVRQSGRRLRKRLSGNHILFLAAFVLPMLLLTLFLVFIATDRYESLASATITEEKAASSSIDLSVLGLTNTASDKDALVLKEFIESKDMLHFLDARMRLREHVSDPSLDFYYRLPEDASAEDFHEYYLWLVTVEFDPLSKVLRFAVQGFDQQFALTLLQLIIERSQQFIDRMNEQVTQEQMRFFDRQIAISETRLKEGKEALIRFQRENRLMTPEGEIQTIMGTIQTLEQNLAQKQSDLSARLAVLDKSAPQLQTLQLEITALESQIRQAKERLTGDSDISISELDSQFREIQLNLEFVTNMYKSNLNALEQARLEAARRLKFLVVVAEPSTPDESSYPNRPYIIVTAAIILIVIYFVLSLTLAIIREHS